MADLPSHETPLEKPREISVPVLPYAPAPPARRRVGPRRSVPPVPEGPHEPDPDPSPATTIEPPQERLARRPAARRRRDGNTITLVKNVPLSSAADNNAASSTGEPSVACHGDVVLYTGNWYAAVSTDGGATFQFVNPFNAFPDPPGLAFCCDQVAQYVPQVDMFVWLLQYIDPQNDANPNVQRIAFATTADVRQGRWQIFDLTPQILGVPQLFLDFPDLAVGANMLYVTTNGFAQDGAWNASILARIPLTSLASGNPTAQHTVSHENFSFRVAQHGGARAFWASHNSTSSLRVFQWDETAPQPAFTDATVAKWETGHIVSNTPDGFNWLGRADPRILGATMAGNELWFAWGANQGGVNHRPHPYTQIARLDATTLAVLDNPNVWDPTVAIQYAALDSNASGEIGISYMFGGGGSFPSHAVGFLTGAATHVTTVTGAHGPSEQRWGDYLTIRRHHPDDKLFVATGYTLQRGSGRQDGEPRFILFGRAGDLA